MKRLAYLVAARTDLVEIYDSIDEWAGPESAQATVDHLRTKCRQLAELSGTLGRTRGELADDLRSFPFRGYVIFFRYSGNVMEVVHIINARRDIDTAFSADD